jgi:hypothetical protein
MPVRDSRSGCGIAGQGAGREKSLALRETFPLMRPVLSQTLFSINPQAHWECRVIRQQSRCGNGQPVRRCRPYILGRATLKPMILARRVVKVAAGLGKIRILLCGIRLTFSLKSGVRISRLEICQPRHEPPFIA